MAADSKTYDCTICGYKYLEAEGEPAHGVAPGTRWKDVPSDWTCPLCGAEKEAFVVVD